MTIILCQTLATKRVTISFEFSEQNMPDSNHANRL